MKITRRAPRIKIGNTTYSFGKNGVSSSTKIAKGVRLRRSANGKQSIGGSFLFWRWSQDLDELGRKKSSEEIKKTREQRKNELSLGLLLTHPIVFFDHLLRRKQNQPVGNQQQKYNPIQQQNAAPQQILAQNVSKAAYSTKVEIYKTASGSLKKVTGGMALLEDDRIAVKANVTKEILYRDISDVHIEGDKVFVSATGRNIPLVLTTADARGLVAELNERMNKKGKMEK